MSVQEMHYTSVKAGPRGSSGFQFVKLTDGVDQALCRQVQPLLGYEPPRSAPARPTPEQIAAFPVALSYTLLPQGGAVLCNTTYTGADYSGRYGNFYAHALYLPGGPADLGAVLPIETWRSPSWCTGPDGPATAAQDSRVERGTITDPGLCRLAQQHGSHIEAFLTDVLHSFQDSGKRVLLVEGDADTVASWIALACRSLPRALAGRLTFTTYTQRPYLSSHQVTGMQAGADFAFSEAEITSQYRVHDSLTGRSSPPAPPLACATAAAALWRAGRPELFTEAFEGLQMPAAGLDAALLEALTGQLAATALAHDVELPDGVFQATVTWAETHPSEGSPQFWRNFAAAIGKGRGGLPAAQLGRLCHAVSEHQPAGVTGPLLTAYLSALPAALLHDPSPDTGTARWAIGRLPEAPTPATTAVAAVLSGSLPHAFDAGLPLDRGLLLLELADAAGVHEVPVQAASGMLAPALLAGGNAAADAAQFLAATRNTKIRERVLDCLHDTALSPSGPPAELASALTGWARPAELTGFPLLHAAADLDDARQAGQLTSCAEAFCHVVGILHGAGLDDVSAPALGMACPGHTPAAREALSMLACTENLPGHRTQLEKTCLGLVRDTATLDSDTFRLAGLLRAGAGDWIGHHDTALLDLVIATGRLQAAAGSGYRMTDEDPATALRLLRFSSPLPQPVREAASAAVLAAMLSPQRLEAGSPNLPGELRELAASGDEGLITAYAHRAEQELHRRLTESPSLHACCVMLWWREEGLPAGTAWHTARDSLVTDLLAPAARNMTTQAREQTAAELNRRQEGLGEDWLNLTTRQPAGTRPGGLSWARQLLRRIR